MTTDARKDFEAWAIDQELATRGSMGLWWRIPHSGDPLWAAWQAATERATAAEREAAAPLAAIGSQMANVCFNWSQEANSIGVRLHSSDRDMLKALHKQWDAAIRGRSPAAGG